MKYNFNFLKKQHLIVLLIITCFSCNLDTSIPISDATGNIDEVIVIMEKQDWQGALGDTIRHYFSQAYNILPQFEPIFDVRYLEPNSFVNLLNSARNVIIFDVLNNDSSTKLNYSLFGDGLKSDKSTLIKKNVYAGGQQILTVFADNLTSLLTYINSKNRQLIKLVADNEKEKLHNTLFLGGEDKQLTRHLKEKLNIDFKVPKGYKMAKEDYNMVWLRFDTEKYTANLVLQTFNEIQTAEEFGVIERNRFGEKFVEGNVEGSFMTTEDLINYYQTPKTINNNEVIESRGLWKLTKDFLGGPFINYKMEDIPNNRTIVLDGFVMAPAGKKRQVMRQLEYWMSTAKF